MIILKIIPYPDNSGFEATWLEQIKSPDVEIPAKEAVFDTEGNEISPAELARTEPGVETETQVWCQSYHPTQTQMFREKAMEFGTSVAEHETMLASIEAAYVPPPPEPVQVPQVITALQGLLALGKAEMSSYYETWANAPDRTFAQKAFINKAMTWRRDDPTLDAAATDLGLTAEQVDNLFILAVTL